MLQTSSVKVYDEGIEMGLKFNRWHMFSKYIINKNMIELNYYNPIPFAPVAPYFFYTIPLKLKSDENIVQFIKEKIDSVNRMTQFVDNLGGFHYALLLALGLFMFIIPLIMFGVY